MYVKRGFFSCCQHNKLIRAYKGSFFLRSFVSRHCRARQGRLDESKAKGKKGKGKGKGKRPEFRCTDLWFDMYSSAELEFVICFLVFVFVCVCELRAVVQHTLPTSIHWDLLSLLRSGAVFKCCCWSSCMQTLGYQVPTGYTRGPTTYLTY